MGPPDEKGRAAIFRHYLEPLKLEAAIDRNCLAKELAALTHAATGADIVHICNRAALLCVKEVGRTKPPSKDIAISKEHFRQAIRGIAGGDIHSTPHNHEPTGGAAYPEHPFVCSNAKSGRVCAHPP